MSANSWGSRFVVSTFGESHGPAMGVVIDGCPSGISFDQQLLEQELQRRRPGSSALVSQRQEEDKPEVLSGVFEGKTLGTPIAIIIRNKDMRSVDYDEIKDKARPGHADDIWKQKFIHADHRGGGRSSGRETISRVAAGAVAKMLVTQISPATEVVGFTLQIGNLRLTEATIEELYEGKLVPDDFALRFPSSSQELHLVQAIKKAQQEGKSFGGIAEVVIRHPPKNLGQPVFHKLKADLASAAMGVGATIGVEFGQGFAAAEKEGSLFHRGDELVYGGIRGGISTGNPIQFRVAFKPTASVLDVAKKGRHDPCIVPRAVPVLEAMTWLTLADHLLWSRTDH